MGFQDRGGFGGPKEMHKTVCSGCKKECEGTEYTCVCQKCQEEKK